MVRGGSLSLVFGWALDEFCGAPMGLSTAVMVATYLASRGAVHQIGQRGTSFQISLTFVIAFLSGGSMLALRTIFAPPEAFPLTLPADGWARALIGFLTLCVVFAFAVAVFGVRVQGSVAGFVGVLATFALMSSTFGLLIAALGRTPEATRGVSILAVLIMVMLGGAWVPAFLFPAWMQRASLPVPTRWAEDGIEAMTWRGLPLSSAVPAIGALLGFALLFGTLALLRFRWEAE